MELPSQKIKEYIKKQSQQFNSIDIKNIKQINTLNEVMNDSSPSPQFNSHVDKEGNICYDKPMFCSLRNDVFTRKINSPYRIDFNWKEGSFLKENIFRPRIYLASKTDYETDFQTDILEKNFLDAISKTIETPKIVFSEPFTRNNLNEFFPDTNDVLICFKSEIPTISRLFAVK